MAVVSSGNARLGIFSSPIPGSGLAEAPIINKINKSTYKKQISKSKEHNLLVQVICDAVAFGNEDPKDQVNLLVFYT